MKHTVSANSVIDTYRAILAFDVSMVVDNHYTKLNAESQELDSENRTKEIERHLLDLDARARRLFYKRGRVVAASTGGYQERLMP